MRHPFSRALSYAVIDGLLPLVDRRLAASRRPFDLPQILKPHARSRVWATTHYGVFVPDLPAPHRYLNTMTLLGASGTELFDLDHLAAFYGVTRLMDETDEALRLRTRQRIIGFANAGGAAHYRYWALSASPEVADVEVDSPEPGRVRISVLAKGEEQTVLDAVLDAVRAVVLRDDIRVLTDTVEVVPAVLIPITVAARIWLYPDTPMAALDAIEARFKEALAAQSGLGWDLTPSWVIGELQRPGVHKVELMSPTVDIRANANQAVRLIHLNLEFAGRDR